MSRTYKSHLTSSGYSCRRMNQRSNSTAVPLLLDDLAATYGAWSVARKIRTDYSGPLIRVRESGSNSEADINAVNSVLDEASLASHCGANSGYITKIYNQDANGSTLDFVQATTTIQPIIVESGTIVKENGKPATKFVAADNRKLIVPTSTALFKFLHNGTSCWIAWVAKATAASATYKFILTTRYTDPGVEIAQTDSEALYAYSLNTAYVISSSAESGQLIVSMNLDLDNAVAANRVVAYSKGTNRNLNNLATGSPSSANAAQNLCLGGYAGGPDSPFDGTIQELILWPTNEAASRETWEADMADFYGVTLA